MTKLSPARKAPLFALIIRATWERGQNQIDAIREIDFRRAWLSEGQLKQAGLTKTEYRAIVLGYEPEPWPAALGGGTVWTSRTRLPVNVASAEEVCAIHGARA